MPSLRQVVALCGFVLLLSGGQMLFKQAALSLPAVDRLSFRRPQLRGGALGRGAALSGVVFGQDAAGLSTDPGRHLGGRDSVTGSQWRLPPIVYGYFLRGFSIASIQLLLSVPLIGFGTIFGLHHWTVNSAQGGTTPAGTVMVAALPIVIGVQLLLSFVAHDMQSEPRVPLTGLLERLKNLAGLRADGNSVGRLVQRNPTWSGARFGP